MPDGWAEADARGCARGVPGCDGGLPGVPAAVGSTSMGPAPGGKPSSGFAGEASTGGSGSVPIGPSGVPRGDACPAGSAVGVSAGGGRAAVFVAGSPPPGPTPGVRPAGTTPGSVELPARCGPEQASTSSAPSTGPTFACAGVEVVTVRPDRGRKGLARGGQVRKGGAWPLTWGQTAARLASCRTSPACCMPVGGHEVRARVMGWRHPVRLGGSRRGHA